MASDGGWRDLMINLVIESGGAERHVCEVQVAHEMMLTARKGLPGHEVYAVQRNAAEFIESCGLEAELRRAMALALKKEGKTRMEILSEFEDAWIVEDAEWAAAAGSKELLLQGCGPDERAGAASEAAVWWHSPSDAQQQAATRSRWSSDQAELADGDLMLWGEITLGEKEVCS